MRHSWRSMAAQPAARITFGIVSGILLQWHVPLPAMPLRVSAAALCALLALLRFCCAGRTAAALPRSFLLYALLCTAGALRCGMALTDDSIHLLPAADHPEKVLLTGVVANDPRIFHDRLRFAFDCRSVTAGTDSQAASGRILITYRRSAFVPGDTLLAVRRGDVLRLRGRLRVPLPPRNPGGFDTRTWLLQEGSILQLSVSRGGDAHRLGFEHPGVIPLQLQRLRDQVRLAIRNLYGTRHAPVVTALLLGDRGLVEEETLARFQRAGIMHLLAVSGLHAGIVLLVVFLPFERLRFALRAVLALCGIWLFAAMTGFAPPVTRAALMSTLYLGGFLLQRRGNGMNSLMAAAAVILLADPLALLSLSFQLSFTAVAGILLLHERINQALLRLFPVRLRRGALRYGAAVAAMTFATQALSLPFLVTAFGQLSIAGVVANLPAIPLVFLVVVCALLSLLCAPLPFLAYRFAAVAAASLDGILATSAFLAAQPFAVITIPALPFVAHIAYVSGIVYLTATVGRMRQKLVILLLAVIGTTVVAQIVLPGEDHSLRVSFLDVGQGDAAVIHLPDGSAILIDTGPGGGEDAGERVILPYLRREGIRSLRMMIITHPDDDHSGGAGSVAEALPVRQVLTACSWPDQGRAADLLRLLRAKTGSVRDTRAGDSFELPGGVRLFVLSPPAAVPCEASNEHSLVLMLVHGSTRFLFTGDADADAERRMIARYDSFLRADVLKVGHHGSTTSTSPGFAVKVRPEHAVISAGRSNRFNHPSQDILTRLRLAGAQVSRTDVEGAVTFVSDGAKVEKIIRSR